MHLRSYVYYTVCEACTDSGVFFQVAQIKNLSGVFTSFTRNVRSYEKFYASEKKMDKEF